MRQNYRSLAMRMAAFCFRMHGVDEFSDQHREEAYLLGSTFKELERLHEPHRAEDTAAAKRLLRLYAGEQYSEVYGIDETGGGMRARDQHRLIEAYLGEFRNRGEE